LQVSQGSVETLFRRGEKRLHDFAANLFRKPHTKFHQNRPSFVEDITKNILVSFFFRTHLNAAQMVKHQQVDGSA